MSSTQLVKQVDRSLVLDAALREECRGWIAHHSKSFYLASRLLPRWVREASWALYAFCRRADDSVDDAPAGDAAQVRVDGLRQRLTNVYRGAPGDHPIDRAFAKVAERYSIPEGLPGELLLGMEMDAHDTQYETFAELDLYCYRVASVVGLMMTCVMRPGGMAAEAWLRAADLGLAMQLTNIARDVGEDARRGRVYLPLELLERHGVDGAALLTKPQMSPGLGAAIEELLGRAEAHYQSAERGIAMLPASCRPAIYASRLIYGAIGEQVAINGYDSIAQRAVVSTGKKLWLALRSLGGLWITGEGDGPGPSDAMLTPRLRAAGIVA